MIFISQERSSDSPYVETIWRTHNDRAGTFISLAASHWEMVVMHYNGSIALTIRGPETKATRVFCPVQAEWFGIVFKQGCFMPQISSSSLVDGSIDVPNVGRTSFWLHGSTWEFPDYDNADAFVDRLVRRGLLMRDPIVDAVLHGQSPYLTPRSIQRRFLRATGLTHQAIHQIERARYAMSLLQQGVSILDTVDQAGYYDQPHLTRSLKHLVGQTPAQIVDGRSAA